MSPTLRLARIDYQPDLRSPAAPIPLGVIVVDMTPQARWVIIGREPRRDSLPVELKTAGRLGMAQLSGWVTGVARDLFEAVEKKQDPFEHISSRWRWNVHVSAIDPIGEKPDATLPQIAARLYAEHVRQPVPHGVMEKPSKAAYPVGEWATAEAEYAAPA